MFHFLEVLVYFIMQWPVSIIVWGAFFLLFKGLLTLKHPAITKLAMLLISFAAIIGILYGALRFGHVITFPSDNTMSWNWLDASWRDDGIELISFWCSVLIGMASAILVEREARRAEA